MIPMSTFGVLGLTARKKLDEISVVNGCKYLNQNGSSKANS